MHVFTNDVTGPSTDGNLVKDVTYNIVPRSPYKISIHYVFSYGSSETERDLFQQNQQVNLTTVSNFSRFVFKEFKYLPGASRSFNCHLIASHLFTSLVTRNQIHFDAMLSTFKISEHAEISFILHNTGKKKCPRLNNESRSHYCNSPKTIS